MQNKTIFQYFEWYLPPHGDHWNNVAQDAKHLAELGFTDVWLPPAYKGDGGMNNVGYAVYDLYDLGEFCQKGTVPTKYGTKDEYLNAIQALHQQGLHVMGDIVLNHRIGADSTEDTFGKKMDPENRLRVRLPAVRMQAWTLFCFPGRGGKYSDFVWNQKHFSSVDYNQLHNSNAFVYKLKGHLFSDKVTEEKGNYDYLMGADVDFSVQEVRDELDRWGRWYLDFTGIDSMRLDAVKHISYDFYPQWLEKMRRHKKQDIFAVGEYWQDNLAELLQYLNNADYSMSLFDVPLHKKFYEASLTDNNYHIRHILDGTLVGSEKGKKYAVTFVDNHDTQHEQPLYSWVEAWFKPLAYALILLRQEGTPCVFYADLYGSAYPKKKIHKVRELEALLLARKDYAYGEQRDYFDHENVIGWTRGETMAVVMSNGSDGWKDMPIGYPGQVFVDMLGNRWEEVTIDENGMGHFTCNSRSVSVWISKN